jgi:quaternary ammonium compound-resistance protein SugE
MAWAMLVAAGLLEILWATAMKESEGFTRLWPSVIGITSSLVSFVVLALALKHLPVGSAYAVWVGIGAGGVAVVGILHFGDAFTPLRLLCIALILSGVLGLRLLER